jgi:hypothetical protein
MGNHTVYILDGRSLQHNCHLMSMTSSIVVDASPQMARMTSCIVAGEQRRPAIDLILQR